MTLKKLEHEICEICEKNINNFKFSFDGVIFFCKKCLNEFLEIAKPKINESEIIKIKL